MHSGEKVVNIFDPTPCMLGEGVLWNQVRTSLLWVDIERNLLLERRCCSESDQTRVWQLGYQVTALAVSATNVSEIWMLTAFGLILFNLETNAERTLGNFKLSEQFRPNDGNPGPDGRYWFGSMQISPDIRNGKVFSVGVEGDYRAEIPEIGIPNTFIPSAEPETLYISDSLVQHTYKFDTVSGKCDSFLDLSNSSCTPDGGALDSDGNLWIALWDGYAVTCFSPSGEDIDSIPLPVPRPTNCCFGGTDHKTLFITSAREGLTKEMLKKHPLSGSVFSIDMPVQGDLLPAFGAEL
ncbi:MAG: SMP-30/gluconolactonase/LRE family protein [Halioglobus sp.]